MSRYYMACLNLTGRECLVVGGGTVGTEKARGLLECGGRVTVVAPEVDPALLETCRSSGSAGRYDVVGIRREVARR